MTPREHTERHDLIDRKLRGTITPAERARLVGLNNKLNRECPRVTEEMWAELGRFRRRFAAQGRRLKAIMAALSVVLLAAPASAACRCNVPLVDGHCPADATATCDMADLTDLRGELVVAEHDRDVNAAGNRQMERDLTACHEALAAQPSPWPERAVWTAIVVVLTYLAVR